MVSFQFDERLLVRCRKRRKKEGHAGIWLTVMLLMLLSIATSRASASCTEKAWGIQSLFSVILICIKKEFDFFGGEVGVRVVSSPIYLRMKLRQSSLHCMRPHLFIVSMNCTLPGNISASEFEPVYAFFCLGWLLLVSFYLKINPVIRIKILHHSIPNLHIQNITKTSVSSCRSLTS